ncbi:MAG: DNA methyltransferase [Planctomycetaceae bacterium]
MTKFEELVAKLSELFELDKADLDFGIHRIIKKKHGEITEYLDRRLPKKVTQVLGKIAKDEATQALAEARQAVRDSLGIDAIAGDGTLDERYAESTVGKQYRDALKAFTEARSAEQTEVDVYSHLYEFFSRYYEDGDFITRRRRTVGGETYAIPYEGEEVVLHWANKDQYYIKSSEDLKDYTFTVPLDASSGETGRVRLQVTRMDAVQNNNKANRVFVLDDEAKIESGDDWLVVPFHFALGKNRTKPEEAEWEKAALKKLPKTWRERLSAPDTSYAGNDADGRTILQKHLRNYTKKNTSDYFIHKDLGKFLRRELDFYVKNEVMHLDDVDQRPPDYLEKELWKIKTIRIIANDLIDFLAQFEDFQKKLWLKKKFVVETQWCVTLDRVPKELYPEIAANDAQRAEWVKLFAIDEIEADAIGGVAYSEPLSVEFLEANDKLLLDTAFFPADFKERLLASFDDIDGQTEGLLVHSDNFHALRLLQERYHHQVRAVYIDPPYNTVHSEIIYKNQYRHSSWLALIANTADLLPAFWSAPFSFGLAIDDFEFVNLAAMLDGTFPGLERSVVVVNHHPQGAGGRISRTHEYLILCSPPDAPQYLGEPRDDGQEDRSFMRSGTAENNYRHGRWKSFYALLLDPATGKIVDAEPPVPLADDYPTEDTPEGLQRVYPINSRDEERVWRSSYETGKRRAQAGELTVSNGGAVYQTIDHEGKRETLFSNWTESIYNAGLHGSNLLGDLGLGGEFDYPKSLHTIEKALWAQTFGDTSSVVLDFFAGSGTTAHAAISINRKHSTHFKYVLVEMGGYISSATKPRIQKAAYSSRWDGGKPTVRDTGASHILKHIRLESYEDALNNLELADRSADVLGLPPDVAEQYLLRYALDIETRGSLLNLERFDDPFGCTLKIYDRETGEAEPTPIDLPETFNYLLGLRVRTMRRREGFLVIEGENPAKEMVLVIWRNVEEKDNAALERFVTETLAVDPAETEYAAIYVNGDNTLDDPHHKILLTEQVFHELMFDVRTL